MPEAFRIGARTLGWSCTGGIAYAYWRYGWPGPWRVAALLLQPPITLALVPFAFLLGAIRLALARAIRAMLSVGPGPTA